jgi:site-specific recombinase XerD
MAVFMSHPKSQRTHLLKPASFNLASVALRDAWTDFILSRQAMQCTQTTLENYRALESFLTWLEGQGVTAPQEVTARHVREYLAAYHSRSDLTVYTYATRIRTLLRFWHREGYLPQPVTFDMPKVRQKRLSFLTAEQVQKVLNVCALREKALVLFLVDSGLRRQEVCNLQRADVDLQTGAVRVRQGKGRKDRLAVIGATTRRALLAYLRTCPSQDADAPLFQTESGSPFTPHGLQSLLRRLSKKAGVAFSAHALRRTFATLSLQNGMDLVSLQTILGHSNLETTRRYIQWLDTDLLEAHRHASPVDNLKQSGHSSR